MLGKNFNLKNRAYKIFLVVMLLVWGFITWSSIFDIYPSISINVDLSAITILLGVCVTFLLLILIYKKIDKYSEKVHNRISYLLSVLAFLILCLWGLNNKILSTYDLSHIIDQVSVLINNGSHIVGESNYLSIYPQQIPLFILIYVFSWVATIIKVNPIDFTILFNCFMIALSFLFMYKILRIMYNSKIALIGMILMMLNPDFYLFTSYYYTDILSIPFGIIGFYFVVKADQKESHKKILSRLLGGILFAIGFKLRVVTVFLLIAYTINVILKNNIIHSLKKLSPVLSSFIIFILLYSFVIEPSFGIKINDSETLPFTHWIMMGVNTQNDGNYTDKDVKYTINSEDKISANLTEIGKRAKKINYKFIDNKIRRVWSQGDHDILRKYVNVEKINVFYKYTTGSGAIFIKYLQQISIASIYVLFLIGICVDLLKRSNFHDSKFSTIVLSIFGAILFYLFWEAQTRYSFSFLPWIIIGGIPSICVIEKFINAKRLSIDKFKFDLFGAKKVLGIIIIVLMILSFVDGYVKYCLRKGNNNFIAYSQYSLNSAIPIIDNEIKQVFRISNDFNVIELAFTSENLKKQIDYTFELYDDSDNLIYKQVLDSFLCTKDRLFKIKIPTQRISSSKEYYFKIYSDEATKHNYLNLGTYKIDNCTSKSSFIKNEGYDVDPNGELYSDNKLLCGQLRMKAFNNKYSNKIERKIFIIYAAVIISITSFCSYYLLIKQKKR